MTDPSCRVHVVLEPIRLGIERYPFPVFLNENARWHGHYVAYRVFPLAIIARRGETRLAFRGSMLVCVSTQSTVIHLVVVPYFDLVVLHGGI